MKRSLRGLAPALAVGALCCVGRAQPVMYAFTSAGEVVRIDRATGAGTLEATCTASFAGGDGTLTGGVRLLTTAGTGYWTYHPFQAACAPVGPPITGIPPGYQVRSLARSEMPLPPNWVILRSPAPGQDDLIARISSFSNAYEVVGATGRADLEGLDFDPSGNLLALGTGDGGRLYAIDPQTGAASAIGPGGLGDLHGLSFDDQGVLYGAGAQLVRIDPQTGAGETIGPTGFAGIEALLLARNASPGCYADCNQDGVLTIADFGCQQTWFVFPECGQVRDCNGDYQCTVADFGCFQTAFILGCP